MAKCYAPNARGLGSILAGGTRFHMTQLNILHATLRPGTAKYIKRTNIKKKKKKQETGNAQGGGPPWDGEPQSLEYWPPAILGPG